MSPCFGLNMTSGRCVVRVLKPNQVRKQDSLFHPCRLGTSAKTARFLCQRVVEMLEAGLPNLASVAKINLEGGWL